MNNVKPNVTQVVRPNSGGRLEVVIDAPFGTYKARKLINNVADLEYGLNAYIQHVWQENGI